MVRGQCLSKHKEKPRPAPHLVAKIITAAAFSLLLMPLLAVVIYSFIAPVPSASGLVWQPSLIWYERLFQDQLIATTLLMSLQVAAITSAIATLLGVAGAIALERGKFPGRHLLSSLTMVPLVMPELVMGLASVIWFACLGLGLGMHTIIIGHVTFALSYVVITVRARLADFDISLEEAAADLGATPAKVFGTVTLPLIAPAIAAGGMMAFTLSFDDFLISFFTAGAGSDTLPMRLYSMIRFGLNREIYALSSLLILATITGMAISYRLRGLRH